MASKIYGCSMFNFTGEYSLTVKQKKQITKDYKTWYAI